MKRFLVILFACGFALAMIGCGESTESGSEQMQEELKSEAQSAASETEMGEAEHEVQEFVTKAEEKLSTMTSELTQIEEKVASLNPQMSAAVKEPLAELKSAHKNAMDKVAALKQASPEGLVNAKAEAEKALNDLDGAFEKVKSLM